jgi:hypothetical protein
MREQLSQAWSYLRQVPPPRGALAVIAVGLFATFAAAVLSTSKLIGAAELEWVKEEKLPDSKPAAIPGGGEMRLSEAGIKATDANVSDYTLYRTAMVLTISADSAIGRARLHCGIEVARRTIVAKTPNTRASYPRSTDDLSEQETNENSLIEFSSHSKDLALVELGDVIGERYTRVKGIVVEWAPFQIGRQVWDIGLPPGRSEEDMRLPFAAFWRTTATPGAKLSCTLENSSGEATVSTAGTLAG